MKHIGLDAGSVSVKVVVLDAEGRKIHGAYAKHHGHSLEKALEMLRALPTGQEYSISITGSSGRMIAEAMGAASVNEIVAQAYATSRLYPHIRSIIEMGGEDSKLLLLDSQGVVKDFSLNSVCAAGTGSFLDQQAERLRLTTEELSSLALKSEKPPRIAGRCSVFAKSDMIHLQQIATSVEDIVAGLCFAVARNFKGSIARGRQIQSPVAFQGGVAANKGMVRAFKELFELEELFVPEDFALMGALGAAMKSRDEGLFTPLNIEALQAYIDRMKHFGQGMQPLRTEGDDFHARHIKDDRNVLHPQPKEGTTKVYLGIDIGSISTNLVLLDTDGRLLSKRYLMTAGRPIEAVRQGLSSIWAETGGRVEVLGVGTTGSGRYMIADYVGADIVKNEITAQATAAAYQDPTVDTIFEIGGQDSKYISLRNGVIVDFEMNKACAAGTGSFLEEQAEKLQISIKGEFAERAFSSECPTRLGERCTVFMENSLMANLQKGAPQKDLLAGLAYSIVQNYINRVVAGREIGERIFFQGGVAFNKSVVAAFEKHLGRTLTVPPNHDVTGAIGMALIAMRHMLEREGAESNFRGFGVAETPYALSSFGCKSCSNLCEINTVKIEGRKDKLFYGGRCEKYDINRKDTSRIPDLFKFRDEALWRHVKEPTGKRPVIGVPYIFFMNEYLPYWSVLLDTMGFDMVISPKTDRHVVDLGLQSIISEACFPVKVALGHVRWLKEKGITDILIPSFIDLNESGTPGLSCPHTQSIPYVSKVALEGLDILSPKIFADRGRGYMKGQLKEAFARFSVSSRRIHKALDAAERAQAEFQRTVSTRGAEALAELGASRAVVIIGRSYNSFERGMNLQIPEKLATLGVLALPMDMLPVSSDKGHEALWPNMYWRSGQRILRAARHLTEDARLYPIYIGNFSCGPDSFILKSFKEALGTKPFLHIEIDEHSADAGAITRCEAFLDSIANRTKEEPPAPKPAAGGLHNLRKLKVYIPNMSDHSIALAAAFRRSGIESEVLPESDARTVEIGMKYSSGKECYPCILTTGDMVKKTQSPDFDQNASAFFMPSGTGPCRFGQYNVFHTKVLEQIGLSHVPVFAPNQNEEFYKNLGEAGSGFTLDAWRGIVSVELLYKCLRESRPYALDKAAAEALYAAYLTRLSEALVKGGPAVEATLLEACRDFGALPVDRGGEERPLIGIVGEIYVRSNRFSNEGLVHKIEDLGGLVWMSPVEEWIHYIAAIGLRRALIKRKVSAIVDTLVKRFVKQRVESKYTSIFEGHLTRLHEPGTAEILKKAAPYVHDSFEGEAVLSIGKAVDLAEKGASGIVNAMPFGCMPGTIVSAIMRAVSRDYGIPCISIPYDGTESSTTRLQLEAFMDQARNTKSKAPKGLSLNVARR